MKPSRVSVLWQMQRTPRAVVSELALQCGIPETIARIVYQRGYTTPEAVRAYLHPESYAHPDPFLMQDMAAAVERIVQALQTGEPIIVYGDYDVDGQASTALMVAALRRLGAAVDFHLPHRLHDGYGLNEESVLELAEKARLLITVDCGITSVREVELARANGLDCIVTDHHEPGTELPRAVAVLNPKRSDCAYPEKDLAGCGVAFKLVQALYQHVRGTAEETADWLDLVALATIADVVPLRGENRAFVAKGLPRFRRRLGLNALCEAAEIANEVPRAGQVAFSLAPRLNAAGRLADARTGVRLLLTDNSDEARNLADLLDGQNRERQDIEQEIFAAAREWIEANVDLDSERALVVAGAGWHRGVIGIVASRLVETYGRPALVISHDGGESVGSGRSIPTYNLHAGLEKLSSFFSRFGGHSMAAGFTLPTDSYEAFRKAFLSEVGQALGPADLLDTLRVDAMVDCAEVTRELVEHLGRLAPFGVGNPEPVVCVRRGMVIESRRIGKDQSHWRLTLGDTESVGQTIGCIGFGMAGDFAEKVAVGDRVDVAGTLGLNDWQGTVSVQLQLRDVREVIPDVHAVEELLLTTSGSTEIAVGFDVDDGKLEPPSNGQVRVVEISGTRIRILDWRNAEGDVRELALRQAALVAEKTLVWIDGQPISGLLTVLRAGTEGPDAGDVVICSGSIPPTARQVNRAALVFWTIPRDAEALRRVVHEASAWCRELDVYVTWTKALVGECSRRLEADWPSVETLRVLYRDIRQRSVGGEAVVNAAVVAASVNRARGWISPSGVRHGLKVFEEAGLVQMLADEAGQTRVKLAAPRGRKVDLTSVVGYNQGISERTKFISFAAHLRALDYEKLCSELLSFESDDREPAGRSADRSI